MFRQSVRKIAHPASKYSTVVDMLKSTVECWRLQLGRDLIRYNCIRHRKVRQEDPRDRSSFRRSIKCAQRIYFRFRNYNSHLRTLKRERDAPHPRGCVSKHPRQVSPLPHESAPQLCPWLPSYADHRHRG